MWGAWACFVLLGGTVSAAEEDGPIDAANEAHREIEALLASGPGQRCAEGAWRAGERGDPDIVPALLAALKAEAAISPGSVSFSRNHILDALIQLGATVPAELLTSRIEPSSLTATLILLSHAAPLDRAAVWKVHAAAAVDSRERTAALWILSGDGDPRAIQSLVSEVVLARTAVVLDPGAEVDPIFLGAGMANWMASHGHRPPRVDFVLRFWDGEAPIDAGDLHESERRGKKPRVRPADRLLTHLNRRVSVVLPVSYDRFTGVRSGVMSPTLAVRFRSMLAWTALERLAEVPPAERESISGQIAVRPAPNEDVDAMVEVALDEEVARFRSHLRGILERLQANDLLPQDLDPARAAEAMEVVREVEDQREVNVP